jgi:hypothetical protein
MHRRASKPISADMGDADMLRRSLILGSIDLSDQ